MSKLKVRMVYLTRREHFNCAHKLYNTKWSKEENEAVFGKCANENWHGHNYHLHITVKGDPDPSTGFVMNAKELRDIVRQVIVDKVDHRNLNLDVPFLQNVIPSTENFAKAIWKELFPHIQSCELHCIKLYETDNIYVEYFGE